MFTDENKKVEFNFPTSDTTEPARITENRFLSDVDFIIPAENQVLFIEYKNSKISDVSNSGAFDEKLKTSKFADKIVRKFYDSLLVYWACGNDPEDKKIQYIFILEHANPNFDPVIIKRMENKIRSLLPFILNAKPLIKRNMIDNFEVWDLEKWNQEFPDYKITYL